MNKGKIYLSIVVPCFNEEANLNRGVLKEMDDYLGKKKFISEIIISDDGSTDKSLEIVSRFAKLHPRFRVLKNTHAGKPFAILSGVKEAKGEIILFTDMDQSTPLNQLDKLLPFFDKNYGAIIGSRGQGRKGFSIVRKLASASFRIIRQIFLLRSITDTQCGFKAFRAEVIKSIFPSLSIFRKKSEKIEGWKVTAFDVELLFLIQKKGYSIAEIPVKWLDRDQTKGKQRKFFKESREMLEEILRVKLSDWRGDYK